MSLIMLIIKPLTFFLREDVGGREENTNKFMGRDFDKSTGHDLSRIV